MVSAAKRYSLHFGKREGSRRRHSWTERREEDRQARFRVLQAVERKTEESQGRPASQVQEIPLGSSE